MAQAALLPAVPALPLQAPALAQDQGASTGKSHHPPSPSRKRAVDEGAELDVLLCLVRGCRSKYAGGGASSSSSPPPALDASPASSPSAHGYLPSLILIIILIAFDLSSVCDSDLVLCPVSCVCLCVCVCVGLCRR